MNEPVKKYTSFSNIRDDYFRGNLKSGDQVRIDGVKVLKIIRVGGKPEMLLLGDQGPVPMLGSLEEIIEIGKPVNMKIEDEMNIRGNYVNHAPKQPSLNFPDQPQTDEYLAIKEITYPN